MFRGAIHNALNETEREGGRRYGRFRFRFLSASMALQPSFPCQRKNRLPMRLVRMEVEHGSNGLHVDGGMYPYVVSGDQSGATSYSWHLPTNELRNSLCTAPTDTDCKQSLSDCLVRQFRAATFSA
jgi:hypothetical protein